MPKIRDLGINTIPITMRPPEIGPGGGVHEPGPPAAGYFLGEPSANCLDDEHSACSDGPTCVMDISGCGDGPSCVREEQTACSDGPSCSGEMIFTACSDGPSCGGQAHHVTACSDGPSCSGDRCGELSIVPERKATGGYDARHFSPEIMAQLRQQLDAHLQ